MRKIALLVAVACAASSPSLAFAVTRVHHLHHHVAAQQGAPQQIAVQPKTFEDLIDAPPNRSAPIPQSQTFDSWNNANAVGSYYRHGAAQQVYEPKTFEDLVDAPPNRSTPIPQSQTFGSRNSANTVTPRYRHAAAQQVYEPKTFEDLIDAPLIRSTPTPQSQTFDSWNRGGTQFGPSER